MSNALGNNMSNDIGSKLKKLRTDNKLTLKELSFKTDFSIGFLSQIERGITSVAISSLEKIASALNSNLSYFFTLPKQTKKKILRSYEHEIVSIKNSQFIDYHLSLNPDKMTMLPRLQVILPSSNENIIDAYSHEGEEFIYILEGILSVELDNEKFDLFPGDSMHYNSSLLHNWTNQTNKNVKLLVVNTPNKLKEE